MKLGKGLINKITGTVLVTFNDKYKAEKQVFDLGLNIKNFYQKVHVPNYVRYVANQDDLADHAYDPYNHNYHARGARHVRKHWEYSEECFNILAEYCEKFRDLFDGIYQSMKHNKQMISVKEMFGNGCDEVKMGNRIIEAVRWIEKQPISHLPFVEMGFDALNQDLIQVLVNQKEHVLKNYKGIQLRCRDSEYLQPHFLY